ncbi:MAG: 30S ribosomal protein S20 [Dehalococcoidia bacterium]
MPRTRTARKADRASKRKQARNRSIKSAVKTHMTRVEKLIYDNDLEQAQTVAAITMSTLDRAAQKNVLHPNTVSRQKSRLTRKLNKALAAQSSEVKPEKAEKAEKPAKTGKTTKARATKKATVKAETIEATEPAEESVEE